MALIDSAQMTDAEAAPSNCRGRLPLLGRRAKEVLASPVFDTDPEAMATDPCPGVLEIAVVVECRNDGARHHFGVGHAALTVFEA